MNVGELKKILAQMDDKALVWARDRDCISLEMVDVVGVDIQGETNKNSLSYPLVRSRKTILDVYGGKEWLSADMARVGTTQAIVFCDCD